MGKVIAGYFVSLGVGTIHWIVELTPILEFATVCVGLIGLTATVIIAWRKVFKK